MGIDFVRKVINVKPSIQPPTMSDNEKSSNQNINPDLTREHSVCLQIWDTSGQERFQTITKAYYKGSHAVVLVYDVTDYETFDGLLNWIKSLQRDIPENIPIVLVGNKSDLDNHREVLPEIGQQMAQALRRQYENVEFFETSAKNSHGIQNLFAYLAQVLLDKKVQNKIIHHHQAERVDVNNDDNVGIFGIFGDCWKFFFG